MRGFRLPGAVDECPQTQAALVLGWAKLTCLFSLAPVKTEFERQDLNLALFCAIHEREENHYCFDILNGT